MSEKRRNLQVRLARDKQTGCFRLQSGHKRSRSSFRKADGLQQSSLSADILVNLLIAACAADQEKVSWKRKRVFHRLR